MRRFDSQQIRLKCSEHKSEKSLIMLSNVVVCLFMFTMVSCVPGLITSTLVWKFHCKGIKAAEPSLFWPLVQPLRWENNRLVFTTLVDGSFVACYDPTSTRPVLCFEWKMLISNLKVSLFCGCLIPWMPWCIENLVMSFLKQSCFIGLVLNKINILNITCVLVLQTAN